MRTPGTELASTNPVAKVLPLIGPAHLDREFDYLVNAEQDESAQPGVRVRVRFAGRLVDGFLLARCARSEHGGRLSPLHRVVSPEQVLSSELLLLAEAVAARYAGARGDVLRLAIPPRHARAEGALVKPRQAAGEFRDLGGWSRYEHGPAFLGALADGRAPHGVWSALPGEQWPQRLAELAATAAGAGRSSVLVVPDGRDVEAVAEACQGLLGPGAVAVLTAGGAGASAPAGGGPAARYGQWLTALRGGAWCVVGTRASVFAPLADLGLVVVWDDGDENHHEQRAPYYHAREVALLRAQESGCAVLVAGHVVTPQGQLLVESGWAHALRPSRAELRASAPRITVAGESDSELARDPSARSARLSAAAFAVARAALAEGTPVLVQTPRKGYLSSLACARCRSAARCRLCNGPLAAAADGQLSCRWCAGVEPGFVCSVCGARALRAGVKGAARTAEELGRAFAGTTVKRSSSERMLDQVPASAVLVVATPGAEPVTAGGYGAALLLDGWQLLDRPHLRATEQAAQTWFRAAALVRPAQAGGRVVISADPASPATEALVRWDPWWLASLELDGRRELGFAPAVRMATVEGTEGAVERFLHAVVLPEGAEALGPVELGGLTEAPGVVDEAYSAQFRVLFRAPRQHGAALSEALRVARVLLSAKGDAELVRVRMDPADIG